ncbi:MAG: IS1380 family transposase [Acidobacteriota bacterium]|nr:IS1380 family transposase [Acidobacteriota bacterium]
MPECIPQLSLSFHPSHPVVVSFDAPRSSSDGGALLLRAADEKLRWTERLAACLTEWRRPDRVRHGLIEQLRQRIYQIALGYEDVNDADHLRRDPVLLTVCDRQPHDGEGLSSQPTLCRFENQVSARDLRRLLNAFEDDYVASLPPDTQELILDIDSTHDPTHGRQQLAFFHGYFDDSIYHPLLVFDGDTGQLASVLLRPGRCHSSRGAEALLRRLIRKIRRRLPAARILVRGDSHFAMPRILRELERLDHRLGGIDYLLGLAKNQRLVRWSERSLQRARREAERTGKSARTFTVLRYRANSWKRLRRVIVRAEHNRYWGANPRFVVTSLQGSAQRLYELYCQRGDCENRIKDLKNALAADRLSCHRFQANVFRLLLHAAAYRLLWTLRDRAARSSARLGRAQFDTLRLRLLKVAALVKPSRRRIWIRLPESFVEARLFAELATGLDPPLHPV